MTSIKNRFERRDDAAGGDEHLDGVVALAEDVHVGFPIGNDVERVILQLALETYAEAVGGPEGGLGFAQLGLFLGRGAGKTQILGEVARFGMNLFEHFIFGEYAGAIRHAGAERAKPVGGVRERRDKIPAHEDEGE